MKQFRFLSGIGLSAILLLFSACNNVSDYNNINESSPAFEYENERVNYTSEELIQLFEKFQNISADSNIISDAPKSISHLSTFECCTSSPLEFEQGLEDFRKAVLYISPEIDVNNDFFSATGGKKEDNLSIYPNYERYKNKEVNVTLYSFNNSSTDDEEVLNFYARSPVGSDLFSFNKGLTQRLLNKERILNVYQGSMITDAEYIGRYSPESEESFQLLDKPTTISQAVSFYENYVAQMPCAIEGPFEMQVNYVDVYRIDHLIPEHGKELYCFDMITSREYENIAFDYAVMGKSARRRGGDMGVAFMIKSDELDSVYGVLKAFTSENVLQYKKFLSCEDAALITSENLTEYVSFVAKSVRLLYCQSDNIGTGDQPGEYKTNVFPMWVFELYNSNDDCTYNCYVNAITGEFESYK